MVQLLKQEILTKISVLFDPYQAFIRPDPRIRSLKTTKDLPVAAVFPSYNLI